MKSGHFVCSENSNCGILLDLLSRLRAEDHVELLPFHGCEESKVTPVQCAEQILAERNSVETAYLISGTQSCIKFKKQPSQPVVSTFNPVQQLHILTPGKTTVVPTKSDSDMFCLQLLNKTLICAHHLS